MTNRIIEWMSSNPSVAQVNQKGEVNPLGEGTTDITVTCGSARASLRVRVTSPTVVGLKVDPVELELGVGTQSQLRALAVTSNGQELEVRAEEWRSSNPSIVRITDDGLVVGLRAGSAKVAVKAAGRRAVISIYVLSRG